jgi:hypothetical protein
MKTAAIHAAFTAPTAYSWSAAVTLRHPENGDLSVQFGNVDRFEDAYEAEFVIGDKIVTEAADVFPGYKIALIDVFRFQRASDAAL